MPFPQLPHSPVRRHGPNFMAHLCQKGGWLMMDTPRENSTHDSDVWLLDRIMNQMHAGVYITDVDTD